MPAIQINLSQARRFLLTYQGLYPPARLQGKHGIMDYIRKVGCIQFDPLNISGHNHELVLQARVDGFSPSDLKSLLYEDRRLVDGWDKMMSIYCVEDWPYFQRYRDYYRQRFTAPNHKAAEIIPQVRAALNERGPLSSIDLDMGHKIDWFWAPTRAARAALESMYYWGELVIHHKVNTRKVYDFARQCLPLGLIETPDPNPRDEDYFSWHIARRIRSVGLLWNRAGDAWLGIFKLKAAQREAAIQLLAQEQKIIEVRVDEIPYTFYAPAASRSLLESIPIQSEPNQNEVSFLAPLDNLLWDRRMVQALFGFNYRWEVYKPAREREFGYYVLPVLYGEHLIGRFEPRLDKKTRQLTMKNWWWEDGCQPSDQYMAALREAFKRFAQFLGARSLRLEPAASQTLCIDSLDI
jgi:uncharacterized protein YcaQ